MNRQILKSVSFIALVLALGIGATYAAFTSNTVTISNNSITTGAAEIKLCNGTNGNGWKQTIAPSLALDSLAPGETDQDVNGGKIVLLGNDGGSLTTDVPCDEYAAGETPGSSDVDMNFVPVVTPADSCDVVDLEDHLSLKFVFSGGGDSDYKTLTAWESNTDTYGPTLAPDAFTDVTILASLDESVEDQGANCTFDIQFTGVQVAE